jgi:hypothetical protein
MSRLSPDALFHFTPSFDNLIGILENHFYPQYCYEEFIGGAIPMVCFCDIRLSQVKTHIKTYGYYGLGMSKEWASRNKLNPVLYYTKNSQLSHNIKDISLSYISMCGELEKQNIKTKEILKNRIDMGGSLISILLYLKPYSGTLYRNGQVVKKNIRFYDERE